MLTQKQIRNFKIFLALTQRDLKIIKSLLSKYIIDSLVFLFCTYIMLVKLFPQMGLAHLSTSQFIGNFALLMIFTGFARLIHIKYTLKQTTFMEYYWSLPISKSWLIAQQITSIFLHLLFTTVFIMAGLLTITSISNVLQFSSIYLISLIFISIMFSFFAFALDERWLWDRVLTPMTAFGCIFFSLENLQKNTPFISTIILINPIIYISEGLRTSILANYNSISFYKCLIALIIFSIALLPLLTKAIKQKLDPVW